MKTLADPEVKAFLNRHFVLAFHNQLPELYCDRSVDPNNEQYSQHMVETCKEGAGGGNVRSYICTPSGKILFLTLGYWKKDRFLRELRSGLDIVRKGGGAKEVKAEILAHIRQHEKTRSEKTEPYLIAVENLFIRSHKEAIRDLNLPIANVLQRIEDDIYLKGAIG